MPKPALQKLYLAAARNRWLQKAYYDAWAAWDWLRGPTPELKPPRKLVAEIGGGWHLGPKLVAFFRDYAGMKPTDVVLEAGCGVGRIAVPLAAYLQPPGRFEGFDIVPKYVDWCRRQVTPRFPHARFRHVDLFNAQYNPAGRIRGEDFRFPYDDATFDFAYLASVFTHLRPAEATNYVAELARVLKPGGRCLATFFLLNDDSERGIAAGRSAFPWEPADTTGARVRNRAVPEECIALPEAFVVGEFAKHGMALRRPPRWGSWCGRANPDEFQDVLLMGKP